MVGNLARRTDRLGRIVDYGYDANDGTKTEKWLPIGGGTAVNTVTHTYDDAGRVTQIQDGASKYAYGYDNADRLTTVNDQGTTNLPQVTLTYGYDNAGGRTSVADSKGGLTTYAYNARGQLTRITQSGTGVAAKRVDLAYDEANRPTSLTRYADLAGTAVVIATSYVHDNANRPTSIAHKTSGGTTRVSYGYAYDAANRVAQETRTWNTGASTDTVAYGYTNDGQLTSVSHSNGAFAAESFDYDANGNRDTSGYSTGTGNRIASDGVYNYAYDDEGNQVSKTEIATGKQTLYKWDHRNRLVEVDSKVGGVTTVLATYVYDALDRRIGRTEGGATTWTLYDGYSPILDFNAAGAQTARYLQAGPDVVDAVLARETASGVAWYLPDRLGTIRDLVDNSGTIIDHVDYNAFGGVKAETNPAAGDRLVGFAGLERSAATGLNLALHRVQDPTAGRWLSEDPIGFRARDPNLRRYVGNDPTSYIDGTGLDRKQPTKIASPPKPTRGFFPTGEELRDPKMFPEIVDLANDLESQSKQDKLERGCILFKNSVTEKYGYILVPPGDNFSINLNKYRRPPGAWKEIGTLHTHPPGGDPDPAHSPWDPQNSWITFGSCTAAVPWLVIDPSGHIYIIGPEKRTPLKDRPRKLDLRSR